MYLLHDVPMKSKVTVGISANVMFLYWLLVCYALPKLAQEGTVV